MSFFDRKKSNDTIPQQPQTVILTPRETTDERRPCWARGRKAFFHRWTNSARPMLPRGVEPCENAHYFQFRSTHAIVEFEDGTVDRVWPQDVQFTDGGRFEEYYWPPIVQREEQHGTP